MHKVRGLAEAERGQRGEPKRNKQFDTLHNFAAKMNAALISFNFLPSLLLLRTLAALRLRARKDSVGVISRSTMLLSHGLKARLRAAVRTQR